MLLENFINVVLKGDLCISLFVSSTGRELDVKKRTLNQQHLSLIRLTYPWGFSLTEGWCPLPEVPYRRPTLNLRDWVTLDFGVQNDICRTLI